MIRQYDWSQKLKEKGYKLTGQRKTIVNYILDSGIKHFNGHDLYEMLQVSHPGIGMATVYRTLSLLEEEGIISKIYLGDDCVRYEINDEDEIHGHHHLICSSCGKVIELKYDLLDDVEHKIYIETGFVVEDHEVKFIGKCKDCALKK